MNNYQEKWESRSSIRTRPRKTIDFCQEGYFFPPDKQTLLILPEVVWLGEEIKKQLLLLTLQQYLKSIMHVEVDWIFSACNKIIFNKLVNYSQEMRHNAYTVILDEYYHVYMANDLMIQLRQAFIDLPQIDVVFSDAGSAIKTIKNNLDQKYHDIFEIIAICIFETTLVRELVTQFEGEDIHPILKSYARDHMSDEARHYGFFFDVLCFTWENLSEESQIEIGFHLADFVLLYLNIKGEKAFNLQLLTWLLGDKKTAEIKINLLYDGFKISPEIPMVKNVLSVLKRAGILDYECVQEAFQRSGLIGDKKLNK